ncbi:uncharacterized protein N7515_001024 [Penicillium bovifimosum]|uniref:Uncharacterized protein n=1 Tax=Penicillium bovifimosum TaxID=126998 RepID=A0A9W9HIM7_9EURO|nr:uncharacterized protein N7515_001024 [Penicillium bovifimosum]KAJ5146460.1 hypothetical protein N7515_001024 [Penicillium bovifimosum]
MSEEWRERSAAPSPDPHLGPLKCKRTSSPALSPDPDLGTLKRKRSSSPSPPRSRPQKRRKKNKGFASDHGHTFAGFIFNHNRQEAEGIARKIYTLPIQEQVESRLVLYGDASIRGAAPPWELFGDPSKIPSNGTEPPLCKPRRLLVAVDCLNPERIRFRDGPGNWSCALALKFAVENIDNPEFLVTQDRSAGTTFLRPRFGHVQPHAMRREVFIFTDDMIALLRLNGSVAYAAGDEYAVQIGDICRLSDLLAQLRLNGSVAYAAGDEYAVQIGETCRLSDLLAQHDVHVELHLSPGHKGIPGNEAADDLSRIAQKQIYSVPWTRADIDISGGEILRATVMLEASLAAKSSPTTPATEQALPIKLPLRPWTGEEPLPDRRSQ